MNMAALPPSCSRSLPPLSGVCFSLQTWIKLFSSLTDLCLMSSTDTGRLQNESPAKRCLSVSLHHVEVSQKKLARNVNDAERPTINHSSMGHLHPPLSHHC